jgi:hypothetical protein
VSGDSADLGAGQPMTVRDAIRALLDYPLNCRVYVGKGMGPLTRVEHAVTDRIYVILSPGDTDE